MGQFMAAIAKQAGDDEMCGGGQNARFHGVCWIRLRLDATLCCPLCKDKGWLQTAVCFKKVVDASFRWHDDMGGVVWFN